MLEIPKIKVVLLGDTGVGKTSILYQFVYKRFDKSTGATLGAMFLSKELGILYL